MFLAALAAMILRALLPAGYMIDPGSGSIVICSERGLSQVPSDDTKAPQSAQDGPCLFAGQTHAAPPPSPVALAHIIFPVRRDSGIVRSETIVPGRGLAAPPPPAHAPPVLI